MATYRIGIGSFNLKDGAVGIGTESSGLGNLKVEGTYKVTDLDVTGVSTFTRYAGFAVDNLEIGKDGRDRTLTGEHQTTGDIVVGVNSTFTVSVGATVDVGTVPSVSIGTHFSPPTGGVEDRPEVPVEGTVRFNKDLNTLEFYNGVDWRQFTVNGARGRGLIMGGWGSPAYSDRIAKINIAAPSDPTDFGTLTQARTPRSFSSSTRACASGGWVSPTGSNIIDYVTIASSGQAADFGDSTHQRRNHAALSSSTRGIITGGESPASINVMDYVEISTTGNAADFGDLTSTHVGMAGLSSPTRGVMGGAQPTSDVVEYITIASKGNSRDFGNLITRRANCGYGSNTTRGVFAGGNGSVERTGSIEFITISSTGSNQYFGDLTARRDTQACCSSQTRVVFGEGYSNDLGGNDGTYDYIELATGGQAVHFGDQTQGWNGSAQGGCSDSHGGLGGY